MAAKRSALSPPRSTCSRSTWSSRSRIPPARSSNRRSRSGASGGTRAEPPANELEFGLRQGVRHRADPCVALDDSKVRGARQHGEARFGNEPGDFGGMIDLDI